ncbi:hypothetical protein [Salibacterium salarium]|uniref:hypothetical protein n=1 Tax=Salibacterium salarium TaxID=284579 RepID=UPI00163B3008|nr:hypothetical protein [Salibacterium salarium]
MFDVMLLFIVAFTGGIVAIVGFFTILSRRISEPRKELQQKVDNLEKEVQELRNRK